MQRVWKQLSSLKLTVLLLGASILLVFIGTVAQADEGLYVAQERYFKHWFVPSFSFFGHQVPLPLPGGYLLGTALLANLIAAHFTRFQWTWKKSGIFLTHVGVILLLVGQLTTDLFSRETQMRIQEGEAKDYSESGMRYELAFLRAVDEQTDEVVAIPQELVVAGAELKHEKLPFTVRVKEYWPNSTLSFRAPAAENAPPRTTNGVARHFDFVSAAATKSMDDKNVPTAILELVANGTSLGEWVAPGWAGDQVMSEAVGASFGRNMGGRMAKSIEDRLTEPQAVTVGGQPFRFVMRPERAYKPFSLTLLKATHDTYPGRPDLPKDFRSRLRLQNPAKGEDRELEIYMNSPLRYAGLTFFQYQMGADDMVRMAGHTPWTVLQVVRNPSWLTPYAGCIIVAAGLVIQFMIHLVGFLSRKKQA